MICYNCGCLLSEHDFCTGCGADVALYKKIISISNRYYNDGLEKAVVRDLTGAITSLRQSLKLNKAHIEARNLLGLVYFEMGEVVSALSEWVISKNLKPKKNIADDYIEMIQSNQARLDSINQTIKKYNQALLYCRQESLDLAVIQLKKVLSLNPRFVRAHQLLALLYLNSEEWDKAKRELQKCCQIDNNNTTTRRYLKEVEHMLVPEEGTKSAGRKKPSSKEAMKYQSGNETIIQPLNGKETKGITSLINLGLGILIGLAVALFLILPAKIQAEKATINDELRVVSEQSDAKTATITEIEQQLGDLKADNTKLQEELDGYVGKDGALQATNYLMQAAGAYMKDDQDVTAVAEHLDKIDMESLGTAASEEFTSLYEGLMAKVGPELAANYYKDGYEDYRKEEFETALPLLEKAYLYDNTNGDALFYLANCYREVNDIAKAKESYATVIDQFPGTEKAKKSKTFLAELNNESTTNNNTSNNNTSNNNAANADAANDTPVSDAQTDNTPAGNTTPAAETPPAETPPAETPPQTETQQTPENAAEGAAQTE